MNKSFIRPLSLLLVFSMLLSITSCGEKNNSTEPETSKNEKQISEDAPWFDSEVVTIDLGINTGTPISSYSVKLVGSDEKNIVVFELCR